MAEIHKCGQGWAYCDGNCATCAVNNYYTTTGTNTQVTAEKDYPPYLDHPKERKKQTNADKIRQMTDEELAKWIARQTTEGGRTIPDETYKCWLDWLKQEVESDA